MNKDGSISPQEKEKLRKRLQKLFQKERYNNGESFSSEAKSNKTSKQDKGSQMKGGKKLQFKTGKVKKPHSSTSASPKNSNKQKQQHQKQTLSLEEKNTETMQQNGFVKSNRKKDSTYISPNKQKNVKQSKQNGFVESSIETKETNMQQNSIDKTKKNEKSQTKNSPTKQHLMKQKTKSNEPKKKTKQNGFVEIPMKTDETKKGQKGINETAVKSNEKLQKTKVYTSPSKQLSENKKTNSNTPQKPTSKEENITKKQTNFNNEQKSSQPKNKTQQQKKSQEIKKKQSDEKVINKTPTKLNNSASNKQTHHQNISQNKPPQKRTAPPPEETSSHHTAVPTTNKKPKLFHQTNNKKDNSKKANKKTNKKNHKNNFDFKADKDEHNEFDLNNMTGCVRGGDFDSDYEEHPQEHKYWKQQHQNSKSDEDSGEDSKLEEEQHNKSTSSSPKNNKSGEKLKKNIITDLQQYNKNNDSSNSDSDDYSDDEEHEFDDSYFFGDTDEYDDDEEEELEEEENYSDYDENDYEEDEDSYDYSDDDEFSSNYDEEEDDEYGNDGSYDFNDTDEDDDYELPKDVPEDLVIHRGTATKRDLKPEDNVSFDSENEEAQIIELEHQDAVKVIEQPKNYDKEELLKLKYQENSNTPKPITFHRKEQVNINSNDKTLTTTPASTSNNETEDDCPKLVPIIDEDGFQLYNPNEDESQYEQDMVDEYDEHEEEQSYEEYDEDDDDENMDEISLGSEYEEINSDDADSIISEDINEKYLCKTQTEYNSDVESIDEEIWQRKHKADIIDATACKYEKNKDKKKIDKDLEINDDIKQLPSMKLFDKVNLKTASSILSTTIIDKKHFKINDYTKDTQGEQEIQSKAEANKALKDKETFKEKALEQVMANVTVNDNITEPLNVSTTSQQDVAMDSMEVIDEVENAADQAKIIKPINHNFSDYQTKFFNALDSNLVLVLLKDPFYIYGTVRLTLLAGCLEVYGHTLQLNQEVELFSPRGCSVIEISPSTNERSQGNLKDILKSYEKHFALADLKTINDNFNAQTNAVVLLKRNESRKKLVQQFKKFMNENVFPNLNNINTDRPLYNSEYLLRCMINTNQQEQKSLKLPKQWQNLQVNTVSRIMLAGGKSVGKSTLIRYLINRHLPLQKKILLIDLDIGQPEIFIPQTVSCTLITQPLLGPGFMLNLQPEIAFAVGHTNIALCPHKYLNAARKLIAYCKSQQEFAEIPWFINTMGYNKGFGLELIAAIAQELPLTDLIQLQSNKDINNFDSILHAHVLNKIPSLMFALESKNNIEILKYRLHVWQSAVEQESRYQKEWEMSAKDMRFAMLLTRLSDALQGHAEWLTDIKPLSASLNDLKIVNLLDNTQQLSTEELAKALEANLVYLCHYQDDNEPLKCLGIGVVRAVDHHIQQVYLIPAVHHSLLKDVNCLALGEMPLPTSLFTNQGSKVKNIAPFVYNTVADNASKAIKQIYHRPRKFLSGKHKSLD